MDKTLSYPASMSEFHTQSWGCKLSVTISWHEAFVHVGLGYNVSDSLSDWMRERKKNKTGVINDPLGQTHTVSPVANIVFCCFVLPDLKSADGRTDERTDNICENNDYYRPWLWVRRVDQLHDKKLSDILVCLLPNFNSSWSFLKPYHVKSFAVHEKWNESGCLLLKYE